MKRYLTIILSFVSIPSFAMFCPNNFNNINIGDTQQQVQQQCGSPSSQNNFTRSHSSTEQWLYYKKTNPTFDQSMVKMTLLISNDRVANINLTNNNAGQTSCFSATQQHKYIPSIVNCNTVPDSSNVASTSLCGLNIQVGHSAQYIKTICGNPDSIKEDPQTLRTTNAIAEWKYEEAPNVTLVFEDGTLKERK